MTEYNAPTPARADCDEWIAHMTFEGETPAERVMLKRDALEASAEQAHQELFADEAATKPVGSSATKKAQKGKQKKETVDGVRVGDRVPGVVKKYHVQEIQQLSVREK